MQELLNKIINGDCLEVMKNIQDNSIDLVVTDPPYKLITWWTRIEMQSDECWWVLSKRIKQTKDLKTTKWYKSWDIHNAELMKRWKMFKNLDIEFKDWIPEIYRVLKNWTHFYCMVNDRNMKEILNVWENNWFKIVNILVWIKNNATPNKYYMKNCEFTVLFRKWKARSINDMWTKQGLNIPNIIWTKKHPTEKPINLMKSYIENSSNENDIVLDPFAWCWSTAKACIELNRNFITTEIDQTFCEIAKTNLLPNHKH